MSEFKITVVGDTHLGGKQGFDGSSIKIPDGDLVIGLGDLVEAGRDDEYEIAVQWKKTIQKPFTMVKGNHDNGRWNYFAKQMCMQGIPAKLDAHSAEERMGMVVWKPMIWEEYHEPGLFLPRRSNWHLLPIDVQEQIVKLRDLTPAYYTFEARGLLFICLDTSNWLLGEKQMEWIKSQVASADKPVVIIGHHHFLPVDIMFDTCQVHERDFMRKLIIENKNIIAYLHGHAHKDRWWKYAHADIIGTGARTTRTITFKNGAVIASELNGMSDKPEPFLPSYLCAQSFHPGQVCYCEAAEFVNPWVTSSKASMTQCFCWLKPESEEIEIDWSMRLPTAVSDVPHRLTFQIRSIGKTRLSVFSPGLGKTIEKEVAPCPDGISVEMEVGPLMAGYYEAKLRSNDGWGYVAMAVPISPL